MFINKYPHILATLFLITFIALGINPVDRDVWIVEVIPVIITFLILVTTFNKFRFSNYSYTLMALWMFWHTVGGHYTFANVPFDFVTELFDFERNHFDRIGHFIIGFYAFPMTELVVRKRWAGTVLASFFGLFFVVTIATSYEVIEWLYAVIEGGGSWNGVSRLSRRCLGCSERYAGRYSWCNFFIGSVLVDPSRYSKRGEVIIFHKITFVPSK